MVNRSRSRSRGRSSFRRSGSRARTPSRSRSRQNRPRSRTPSRRPRKKATSVRGRGGRSRSRTRSVVRRSRSRGGVDLRPSVGNRVVGLLGRIPSDRVSAIASVDYRATRRRFALEGDFVDVRAKTAEDVRRFFVSSAAFKEKITELDAKDVDPMMLSLSIEFPRGKSSVFGKIHFVANQIGAKVPTYEEVMALPEVKTYDLRACPNRFNVKLPPVRPWERHMTDIRQSDFGLFVAVKVIGRKQSEIGEDDIFIQLKGQYEFSGEYKLKQN